MADQRNGNGNGNANVPRELKESWLFKSGKSESENSGTTHEEHQERVEYELNSKGAVTVVGAGGERGDGEERRGKRGVEQHEVDLEKGLGQGHGGDVCIDSMGTGNQSGVR